MRLHFPKPLNGWRPFVGEVGVVVLGVLIALAASQTVEAWQWHQRVSQADNLFANELNAITTNAYLRLAIEPCLAARRKEIVAALLKPGTWRAMPEKLASREQTSPPLPYHTSSTTFAFVTEGWNNALANGTVNQLPVPKAANLAQIYKQGRDWADAISKEAEFSTKLAPLASDVNLPPESRIEMLQILARLNDLDDEIQFNSFSILNYARSPVMTALPGFSASNEKQLRQSNKSLFLEERQIRGSCVQEPAAI